MLVSAFFPGGVFGIYFCAIDRGRPIKLERTLAVNTLVVMEIFHLFFIRNIYGTSLTWQTVKGTKIVRATVPAVTAVRFAITYVPFLQGIFETQAVPLLDGVIVVGIGVVLFALIETEKQVRLRTKRLRSLWVPLTPSPRVQPSRRARGMR